MFEEIAELERKSAYVAEEAGSTSKEIDLGRDRVAGRRSKMNRK